MTNVVNVNEVIGKVLRSDDIVATIWRNYGKARLYFNLFGKKFHWLELTEADGVVVSCEAPDFNIYRDFAPERERRQMTIPEVHALLKALGQPSALVEEAEADADADEEEDEEATMIAIALEMASLGCDGEGWEPLARQLTEMWKGIVEWSDDRVEKFQRRARAAADADGWGVWGIPHLNLRIQREIDYRVAGGDPRAALIVGGGIDTPDL